MVTRMMQSSYKLHLCVCGCVCVGGGGGRVVNVLLSATTATCYCSSTYQFTYRIAGNLANIEFSEMVKNGYKFILAKFNDMSAS